MFKHPYVLIAAVYFPYLELKPINPGATNTEKGTVILGRRHDNCFKTGLTIYGEARRVEMLRSCVQGFLTSDNRFVDRKEALCIATDAGQLENRTKHAPKNVLLSEDLY